MKLYSGFIYSFSLHHSYRFVVLFTRVCPDLEVMLDLRVPLVNLEMLDHKVVKVIRDLPALLEPLVLKDLKAAWE